MNPEHDGALGPYLRALGSHRLAFVLAVLACIAGAAAWLELRTPDYQAEAEILVTPLPEGDQTFIGIPFIVSGDPTRTVQTAATLVSSSSVADATAERLGDGVDGTLVEESVTVEPKGESNVLAVAVTATDPELAADMANTFAETALQLRTEALQRQIDTTIARLREGQAGATGEAAAELSTRIAALESVQDGNDPTLSISERATAPSEPVGFPAWLVLGLAGFAGVIVGLVLTLLLELSDRRVRGEDELLAVYPLPVLTRVPVLSRRRLRRAATAMPPEIREAFRTLQAQLDVRGGTRRAIMVTSGSRNDGKTSSALNLALSLVATGHGVLLIDFDLRKPDVATRLGIVPGAQTLSALLDPDTQLEDVLVAAPRMPLLRVLPATTAAGDVAQLEALLRLMPRVIDEAIELADYVVVDTAPVGEVSDALKVAEVVDDILVVTRPGRTNRANLEQARDLLEGAGRTPTGLVVIGERAGASNRYYSYGVADRGRGPLGRLTTR